MPLPSGKFKVVAPDLPGIGDSDIPKDGIPQMKLVAENVTAITLNDTGHWVMEERFREVSEALSKFL